MKLGHLNFSFITRCNLFFLKLQKYIEVNKMRNPTIDYYHLNLIVLVDVNKKNLSCELKKL